MAEVLKLIGHWLLGIVGVLLCYSAVFLRKNEEGKLENIIQKWWERVYRLQGIAVSRETAFIKIVIKIVSDGFAFLFGESLFQPRAFFVSICFSLASIYLTGVMLSVGLGLPFGVVFAIFICGIVCLLLGIVRPILRTTRSQALWKTLVGKACELAGENGETNLLQKNQELLALYQNHQPYRDRQLKVGN